jgi:uncharacterized protein (TIGR02284 family)
MATTIGTEDKIEDLLAYLICLDRDAAVAYDAAIERLRNAGRRSTLAGFRQDHLRHIDELGEMLSAMGKTPPDRGNMKGVLSQGKIVLGALMGDKAVLQAMKINEDETNAAYERAVQHRDATPALHQTLERALCDERRHRDWMVETIQML